MVHWHKALMCLLKLDVCLGRCVIRGALLILYLCYDGYKLTICFSYYHKSMSLAIMCSVSVAQDQGACNRSELLICHNSFKLARSLEK